MARRHMVQFDARKTIELPTGVDFRTKDGRKVHFTPDKPTKVPVRVKFRAKDRD